MKTTQHHGALALYHRPTCPYCVITRQAISQFGIDVELRNIQSNATYRKELIQQGGKLQVPSLRIENENGQVEWLYESQDIIRFLKGISDKQNNSGEGRVA